MVRDFKNLSILLPLETAEATSILKVEELADNLEEKFDDEFGKSEDFSLHEALWQCQSLFANATGKFPCTTQNLSKHSSNIFFNSGKIGQKKILLISSDDDPHGSNPQKKRQAMQKARDLHDTG